MIHDLTATAWAKLITEPVNALFQNQSMTPVLLAITDTPPAPTDIDALMLQPFETLNLGKMNGSGLTIYARMVQQTGRIYVKEGL